MINDNLLATEATATPIFWVVIPITVKIDTNSTPITMAHRNQGVDTLEALMGKNPFTTDPVITQVI